MTNRLKKIFMLSLLLALGLLPGCASCDNILKDINQERLVVEKKIPPKPLMDKADEYLKLVTNYRVHELGIDGPRKQFYGDANVDLRVFFALGLQAVPVENGMAVTKLVLIAPSISGLSKDSSAQEVREVLFASSGTPELDLDNLDLEYEKEEEEIIISEVGSFEIYEVLLPMDESKNSYKDQKKLEYDGAFTIFRDLLAESQDANIRSQALAWLKDQLGITPGPPPEGPLPPKKIKRKILKRPSWWGKRRLPETPIGKKKNIVPSVTIPASTVIPPPPTLPPSSTSVASSSGGPPPPPSPRSSSLLVSSGTGSGDLAKALASKKKNLKKAKVVSKPISPKEDLLSQIRLGNKKLKNIKSVSIVKQEKIAASQEFAQTNLDLSQESGREAYEKQLKKIVSKNGGINLGQKSNVRNFNIKIASKDTFFKIMIQKVGDENYYSLFYVGPELKIAYNKLKQKIFSASASGLGNGDLKLSTGSAIGTVSKIVAEVIHKCSQPIINNAPDYDLKAEYLCQDLIQKYDTKASKSVLDILNRRISVEPDDDSDEDWSDDDSDWDD